MPDCPKDSGLSSGETFLSIPSSHSLHFVLWEKLRKTTSAQAQHVQLPKCIVTLKQGEWTQASEWLLLGMKVDFKLLGILFLTPTADERRHTAKSVFLTSRGEFK